MVYLSNGRGSSEINQNFVRLAQTLSLIQHLDQTCDCFLDKFGFVIVFTPKTVVLYSIIIVGLYTYNIAPTLARNKNSILICACFIVVNVKSA